MQIQKKGNFWSRIKSKNDQKWLLGEMTLKTLWNTEFQELYF